MRILFLARTTLHIQPGGDTVQMVETAKALRRLQNEVDIAIKGEKIDFAKYDLVHFFNLGRPAGLISYIDKISCPIFISTIWVDYTPKTDNLWVEDAREYAKSIARWINKTDSFPGKKFLMMGQTNAIKTIINRASCLITTTDLEAGRIQNYFGNVSDIQTIPPGISDEYFSPYQVKNRKGIIIVGRIEKLKNQKAAIEVLNELNYPVKIIGNSAVNQKSYYKDCKQIAGSHIKFIPFLEKEKLIEEYRKAELLVLPSLFETFGLVALEAWSQGCKLALSDRIESYQFYKDKALFFDPFDKKDMKQKILNSINLKNKKINTKDLYLTPGLNRQKD